MTGLSSSYAEIAWFHLAVFAAAVTIYLVAVVTLEVIGDPIAFATNLFGLTRLSHEAALHLGLQRLIGETSSTQQDVFVITLETLRVAGAITLSTASVAPQAFELVGIL